jgi:fumarylpyruvate hydrolase
MNFIFPLATPGLPIRGRREQFPVRRIYCVGRNFADHAREMGASGREPPFFFAKPADALVPVAEGCEGRVAYPSRTADLHHEIELVVAIGRGGADIPAASALEHVFGYGIGVDLTRRDIQAGLKQKGHPWEMAKAFDQSAPVGTLVAAADCGHPAAGAIWLRVNGVERQRGDLSQMIWSVPEVIAELSGYVELRPGDLIFTGTPAGVGPVARGDHLLGGVAGVGELALAFA